MDVRAELAAARGHSARGLACADPAGDALGVDEHLLDLGARGRLEGGHRGGADEDGVHGHRGETVVERPLPGEIVGRAFWRADPAADGEDDVRPAAELAVGGEEEVVEGLPRVVPAGAAALDLHDDRDARRFGGYADDLPDLCDGAWLEGHVSDAGLAELVDELDRIIKVGNAGGDDDAVERDAGGARLLHEALAADLHVPQVGVEEEGVELGRAARLEQLGQALGVRGEDGLGDLSTAGELRPVARVRRGGDDGRIDGRRSHACQHDGRGSGETGERGLYVSSAIRKTDQARLVSAPGQLDRRRGARSEEVA